MGPRCPTALGSGVSVAASVGSSDGPGESVAAAPQPDAPSSKMQAVVPASRRS